MIDKWHEVLMAERQQYQAAEAHRDRCEALVPELVAALEMVRDGMEASGGWTGDEAVWDAVVAAIAKAEGKDTST